MRTVGSLMMALSALALFAGVGCKADGYTPQCVEDGYSDCLPPPEGGTFIDAGTDTTSQPDTAVDQDAEPEAAAETGPDTEPPDSDTPDTELDAEPDAVLND
jgi:hypothetical protein